MKKLLVMLILLLLFACNVAGCNRKYEYSYEEYLERIAEMEDNGDEGNQLEKEIDFNKYEFDENDYPEVYEGFNESIGDSVFTINGFKSECGLTSFYFHSCVALDDFKIIYNNGNECVYELPYLACGVTKITLPALVFRITGIEGNVSSSCVKGDLKIRKCGQGTYRIKEPGIYLFMNDGIVLKSCVCEKGLTTAPSLTNNILRVE